jgi:predicted ArsR family transcriptional regulator
MTRKVNRYLISIPIVDIHEAKILGSDTNWNIINVLRDAGAEGLSAEQISKEIRVPIHSVYGDLKQLQAAGLIEGTIRRPSWGRPPKETKQRSGGKPTKIYTENIPWGYSQLC